jgi:hypothetical protein
MILVKVENNHKFEEFELQVGDVLCPRIGETLLINGNKCKIYNIERELDLFSSTLKAGRIIVYARKNNNEII